MSLAESLKHVALFSGLDDKTRQSIARLALDRTAPAGRLIVRDGEPADGFYVVLDGKVKVYKLSPDGRQQILHVFGPGQAFGEAAMFAGETFPAFAEALAESRLAFFPRDRFLKGLGENPALAFGLIAALARLFRQLTSLVEQVALTDVAGRLARHLTDLARR
jgi:CRP/FNR family transcriptional regulator